MPKQKPADVNKLLTNMKGQAASARGPQKAEAKTSGSPSKTDSLNRQIDLSPYKEHQAWPGRGYMLVGNSYNPAIKAGSGARKSKRANNIAKMLESAEGKDNYVSVQNALQHAGFKGSLSRFEYDWLKRETQSSVIGAAYDEQGHLLPDSFAVWRSEAAQKARQVKGSAQSKELVAAR